jgi:signal peptidase I
MNHRIEPTFGEPNIDAESRPGAPAKPSPSKFRRRPWLAFLLGFLVGPISWIYVGRFSIGVLFYIAQLIVLALLGFTGWAQSVGGEWFAVLFALATNLISIVAAWLIARRVKDTFQPRWYNRWYWYPVLWLIVVVPVGYAAFHKATLFGFDTYRIPSGSMQPTIAIGDFVVADTRSSAIESIARGDIVVHHSITYPNLLFIRRVVGLPGEHVVVSADAVQVDGKMLTQGRMGSNFLDHKWMRYSDLTLGPNEYFLMGDNRENSIDSRTEGAYARSSIVGVATTRWYSATGKALGPFGKSTP